MGTQRMGKTMPEKHAGQAISLKAVSRLRRRISDKLLDLGTTLQSERQEIWRKSQRSGLHTRDYDPGDLHVLAVLDMLDVLSNIAIRLGVKIMPTRLPHI
jgi:hypothetical protein